MPKMDRNAEAVDHGEIELSVSVQISDADERGPEASRKIDTRCERPVTVAEKDRKCAVVVVGNDQVRLAITVEVGDGYVLRVRTGGIGYRCSKAAIAVTHEYRDRVADDVAA